MSIDATRSEVNTDEDFWSNTEYYTEFGSITVSLEDILKAMEE